MNYERSNNPYTTGIRPRQFFSGRVAMLRKEQMLKKTSRNSSEMENKETDGGLKAA